MQAMQEASNRASRKGMKGLSSTHLTTHVTEWTKTQGHETFNASGFSEVAQDYVKTAFNHYRNILKTSSDKPLSQGGILVRTFYSYNFYYWDY